MIYRLAIALLSIWILTSCSYAKPSDIQLDTETKQAREVIFWINSLRVDCIGVAPMHCLQVQKSEQLNADEWQLFYSSINGFQYEAGYVYKLSVREEVIPADQVPADASSIRYTLIEELEKTIDAKLRLNDIWALETIQQQLISPSSPQGRPQLEIHLRDMAVFGSDGCNNFTGGIQRVDANILMLGPIASTSKLCQEMEITDRFNSQLSDVQTYSIKELKLYLLDAEGNELLRFQKID